MDAERLVKVAVSAIVTTLRETGGSAPSGILYAALSEHGCSLDTYQRILGALRQGGIVEVSADVVRLTPRATTALAGAGL